MIDRIPELVISDANLVWRGRYLSTTFMLEIGDRGHLVKIHEGRVVSITPGPFVTPNYSFALRAPRDPLFTHLGTRLELHGAPSRPFALLAHDGAATLSLSGFAYNADHLTLPVGSSHAASNATMETAGEIELHAGSLLVVEGIAA